MTDSNQDLPIHDKANAFAVAFQTELQLAISGIFMKFGEQAQELGISIATPTHLAGGAVASVIYQMLEHRVDDKAQLQDIMEQLANHTFEGFQRGIVVLFDETSPKTINACQFDELALGDAFTIRSFTGSPRVMVKRNDAEGEFTDTGDIRIFHPEEIVYTATKPAEQNPN